MTNTDYRFSTGEFECRVVSDGTIMVPDTINNKPYNPRDPQSGIVMDVMSLFVRTPEHKILIDTGSGIRTEPSNDGKLLQNLKSAGIKAADIDMVILTHAHSDHCGGNTYFDGTPVFPAARYFIHRREWEYWTEKLKSGKGDVMGMFEITRKKLLPVQDRIELVEENREIIPGIEFIPVPGHTPGHIMLEITSGKNNLVCLADIMHHSQEFTRPEIFTIFDVAPHQAVSMRSKITAELARTGVLVFACHFPFPGLGHIIQKEHVLSWLPLKTDL